MMALALLLAQASLPSPAPAAGTPVPIREVYERRCAACHGTDGKGKTKRGRKLKAEDFSKRRWQEETTDEEIIKVVTNGIQKKKMPAFRDKLSEKEIQALVPYLRDFAAR